MQPSIQASHWDLLSTHLPFCPEVHIPIDTQAGDMSRSGVSAERWRFRRKIFFNLPGKKRVWRLATLTSRRTAETKRTALDQSQAARSGTRSRSSTL